MLSRVRGFRRLFDEGEEDVRAHFAEQHDIFSQYLPYAIVFGCTKKWAKTFEGLDAEQLRPSWYVGNTPFNALHPRERGRPLRHRRDRDDVREHAVVVELERVRRRRLLRRRRRRWRRRKLVTQTAPMNTIADLVRARADDDNVGLRFEDSSWTYAEAVRGCAQRAAWLLSRKPADAPFHVGVLLDNMPEFWMLLGAAALSGATLVGINPTRRGAELARDLQHTDCALLVTETSHLELLEGAGDVLPADAIFVTDRAEWDDDARTVRGRAAPRRRGHARPTSSC